MNMFPLRVSYISTMESEEEPLQFGVGVSGKWFKKAVDRNRVKRLVRESWRLQKNGLKRILLEKQLTMIVFIVYTGRELPEYENIRESVSRVIDHLSRIANEVVETNI
jgi:ribonuclease P protein component